jgi:hypothetical protein
MALQRNDPLPKKTQPPIVVWVYFETDVDGRRQCRRLFSSFKPKKFEFEFCVVLNVLGG